MERYLRKYKLYYYENKEGRIEWMETNKQLLSDPIELGGLGEGRRVRALVVVLPFLFSSLESYSAHAPLKTPFLLLFLVFAPGE